MSVSNGKYAIHTLFVAGIAALANLLLWVVTCNQLVVTQETLEVYKDDLRISHRPRLEGHISPLPELVPIPQFDRAGKESELWQLPYYIINVSAKPAYNFKYYHKIDRDSTFEVPNVNQIQTIYSKDEINPDVTMQCGFDEIYRQQVLDKQKRGEEIFRHFYFNYEDEFGNEYKFRACWKLAPYKVGDYPEWLQVAYRNLLRELK